MGDSKGGGGSGAPRKRDGIARRARRIIEAEFTHDHCHTRSISRRLGVTRSRLCHAYRKAYDSTIGRDLRRLRIEAACCLLDQRPGELIKEVAAAVGFGHRSYRTFLNSFTQEVGMPPRRYRRRAAAAKLRTEKSTEGAELPRRSTGGLTDD